VALLEWAWVGFVGLLHRDVAEGEARPGRGNLGNIGEKRCESRGVGVAQAGREQTGSVPCRESRAGVVASLRRLMKCSRRGEPGIPMPHCVHNLRLRPVSVPNQSWQSAGRGSRSEQGVD